jgi:protein disulfide-isomerase A1
LVSHTPRVTLIKVDATVEEELAEKYNVRGFPSLKWFRKGAVSDYGGGRTGKTIVEWIKKKTGPPAVLLSTRDEIEEFTESNDVVVVGFLDHNHQHEKEMFNTAAYGDDQSGVPYGLATSELASHYDAISPSVIMFKKFDEGKVNYVNDWTVAELSDFVLSHSMPLLVPFTEETAPKIFGGIKKVHMLLFCDIDSHVNIQNTMKLASKAYRGEILFITIDSKNTRIIEFFNVDVATYPTARLVEMGDGNLKKYLYETPTLKDQVGENEETSSSSSSSPPPTFSLESLSDVSKFISMYKQGKLMPSMKSEPIPTNNNGPVTTIVGKTFDKLVTNNNEDVLIEFYAPWCGHCKRLQPVWEELGVKFKDITTVRIAKMDATLNEHEVVDLSGFPTIMFWPAKKDDIIPAGIIYEGVRELSGFLEFIQEHAVHSFNLPENDHNEL